MLIYVTHFLQVINNLFTYCFFYHPAVFFNRASVWIYHQWFSNMKTFSRRSWMQIWNNQTCKCAKLSLLMLKKALQEADLPNCVWSSKISFCVQAAGQEPNSTLYAASTEGSAVMGSTFPFATRVSHFKWGLQLPVCGTSPKIPPAACLWCQN